MSCEQVLRQLSEFFDEVLDPDTSIQISQHLGRCAKCRGELDRLSEVHQDLRSLRKIQAPEYLEHLIKLRLAYREAPWRIRVKNELQRSWSRIRHTEGLWYWTRALGAVMTSVFFFLISFSITPFYLDVSPPYREQSTLTERNWGQPAFRQQVGNGVLKKLGMLQLQPQQTKTTPAINDEYLFNFGQSVSRGGDNDNFSVVTVVDQSGSAKIQDVLQYPTDRTLLNSFNEMISTARCRPASQNGKAVPSHLVLMFSKISVYD
jgi:hypothetical protein